MLDRKTRLVLNSGYSLLSWLAPALMAFAVTPVLINGLGSEAYGVYLVLIGIFNYVFTFNVGRAVAKYVAEYRSIGDVQKLRETVSSGFWLNLSVGIVGAGVIALLAGWLVSDVLAIAEGSQKVAVVSMVLGAFSIPAILVTHVFQSILQGVHRFGIVSVLTNVHWLILNVGNVVLVLNGYGIDAIFAWNLMATLLGAAASFLLVRIKEPELLPGVTVTRGAFNLVLSYGLSISSYQVFGIVLLLFERAWLVRKFGGEESAYYLLPLTLALYLHSFVAAMSLALFPVVNELLADKQRLVDLYKKATKVAVAITVFAVATMASIGRPFFLLWVGADFAENAYVNLVFHFLTFGLLAIMIIIWQINEAHRAARLNAIQVFFWAALAIPLMILVSGDWRSEGVAAARFIALAVTIPMVFYSEHRFFGGAFWGFWGSISLRIGAAVFALVVVERVTIVLFEPSWPSLIMSFGSGALVFGGILLATGFITREERKIVRGLLGKVLRR